MFYLKKRGLWYRPKAKGYTDNLLEAGLYDNAEATERAHDGVVTKHSLEAVQADVWKEMQASLKRTAELASLWERLGQL